MPFENKETNPDIQDTVRAFDDLRRFEGSPPEFWAAYMDAARRLAGGDFAVLLVAEASDESWKTMGVWPGAKRKEALSPGFDIEYGMAAQAADSQGAFSLKSAKGGVLIAVKLDSGEEKTRAVALFYLASVATGLAVDERLTRLALVADIPLVYKLRKDSDQARNDVIRFADTLDLLVLLNQETRYMAAVMTFVNELAARFHCSRVSLGWLDRGYVRMEGISHMDQFEKKMDAVQALEKAMDETLDQDEEIVYPPVEGMTAVTRAHGEFAERQGGMHMVSLPLRPDGDPVAVLVCERDKDQPKFTENEIQGLRLFCDQAARRLSDLRLNDVWLGTRLARGAREKLSGLLGVEHTFTKVLGVICFLLLAFFLFGRLEYRVEAPFILKTDDVAYLPSPFDGYIKSVHVRVGDAVSKDQLLLTLDTQELLIEESSAIADRSRYNSEAEKSRASGDLAEMKIAETLRDQADARLELIRYHLSNAEVRALFAGIVVEGDLNEMLGAPVRKGDIMFKVARIEHLYAELNVDERDVHEIKAGNTGQIAFVSKPENNYPVKVSRVDPVALAKEAGNVFPVTCQFQAKPQGWWRPGMSGIAKVGVGKRNVCWIVTHRTVDFLRLYFWW